MLRVVALVAALLSLAGPAVAQAPIKQQRVQFAKGASAATIQGAIKGSASIDYIVGARAGQTMTVSMKASNGASYFNIIAPGETDVAFYNGGLADPLNSYKGVLPASGDYRIRVYLMRSAARRNESSNHTLSVAIKGAAAATGSADAKVPGTKYNATSVAKCRSTPSPAMGSCALGVVRKGNGTATVEIDTPDGGHRTLYFTQGRATSSDAQAPVRAERRGDITIVRIGQYEYYEIVDAVIYGG